MVPNMYDLMVPPHVPYDFFQDSCECNCQIWSLLTLYGTGIVWSPTCAYCPPLSYMEHVSYGPPTCEVSSCLIWFMDPHTLYGTGIIWSPHVCMVPPHVLYVSYGPPYLIWFGILWSPYLIWNRYGPPNMYVWSHHMWSVSMSSMVYVSPMPYMEKVSYGFHTFTYGPPYLIWKGIIWSPSHVHMVPQHVKCLYVLYDCYGPPYLIWNRYHMVPHMYVWSPQMYNMMSMTLIIPYSLYGIGIWWSPLP